MKKNGFVLDVNKGYFNKCGVDIMAFDDIYPVGHQSGVSIISHGKRLVTNGDIRFEQTPGQWQPVPKQLERSLDEENNAIVTKLTFPDKDGHLKGFNPMIYPDFEFEYEVRVEGFEDGVKVIVDLDKEIPERFFGKLCFNLELFPGEMMGKHWIMDDKEGIFPTQPNAPTKVQKPNYPFSLKAPEGDVTADKERLLKPGKGYNPIVADDLIALPYGEGHSFTLCPEDEYMKITISSDENVLKLYDGRMNHNNGWFALSCEIPMGKTKEAVCLTITPNVVPEWIYPPVVQVSQVGYHSKQPKRAIVELDARDTDIKSISLYRLTAAGPLEAKKAEPDKWGKFLRYNYLEFDFSNITEEGLYKVIYGDSESAVFRIAPDIYERGVWQPVLEYFLPVQMCHMRVNEKYRVWHGRCHCDDGRMAPLNLNHFDGCVQSPSTMCNIKPGERVPGINKGGWHDAGDFDLRIESQTGECYNLAMAFEEFDVYVDETSIDQERGIVEIHEPDGRNDILQQIEHGLLSVVGAYKSMGRLYHDIICPDLRQYVLLGDPVNMTDNIESEDDRLVFMEDNPRRELSSAAHLAASARAMRGYNDELALDTLKAATQIYEVTDDKEAKKEKIHAAAELLISTGDKKYSDFIVDNADTIVEKINELGWVIAKVIGLIEDSEFKNVIKEAMMSLKEKMEDMSKETPYGIPYRPHIWGAGWNIQALGAHYYFLNKAYPDIFKEELIYNALNFILGCHPGCNTSSFASGVGAKSTTTAYGFNRADWSYIPGGVASGTALIRPDFPELLEFPFLWQQMEYVIGGGSSHYMFLVLAAKKLLDMK